MKTTGNIFDSALVVFSGVSRSSFVGQNTLIAEAAREMKQNVMDIPEAQREMPLLPVFGSGDLLYAVPEDLDKIISITPVGGRSLGNSLNEFNRSSGEDMAQGYLSNLTTEQFKVEYRMGVPLLRVQGTGDSNAPLVLHSCASLTANGTVTVEGDANNVAITSVWYLTENGAIDFDITQSTGTSRVVFTDIPEIDISDISRDGMFKASVYIPEELVGKVTSIKLRLGQSGTAYKEMTATQTAYNGAFVEGYNEVSFVYRNATTTGAPTDNITYMVVEITHTMDTATVAKGVRVDNIVGFGGEGLVIKYYSRFHFIDGVTGAFIETPTSAGLTDTVIYSRDTQNLMIHELRKLCDQHRSGDTAGIVWKQAQRALFGLQGVVSEKGAYASYRSQYPSQRKIPISHYANF